MVVYGNGSDTDSDGSDTDIYDTARLANLTIEILRFFWVGDNRDCDNDTDL